MKKLSVLAIAAALGIAGSSVFPVSAAEAKLLETQWEGKNVIILGGQASDPSELKNKLEELCSQLGNVKIDWSSCPIITLPCPSLPETDKPETDVPGTDIPDDDKPETDVPETDEPETDAPETGIPDGDKPETDVPETDKPETDAPGTDIPGGDKPETDVPETDKPGTDAPDADKPGADIPETDAPAVDTPGSDVPGTDNDQTESEPEQLSFAEQVVKLVNEERAKAGLNAVVLDKELEAAALIRAKETELSFSHTRPDGRPFASVLKDHGISYRGAGENIAWGQSSPEEVMRGWMNSEGHRANILNPNFTKIGVGYYRNANGRNYWTQLFTY